MQPNILFQCGLWTANNRLATTDDGAGQEVATMGGLTLPVKDPGNSCPVSWCRVGAFFAGPRSNLVAGRSTE